jgi:hypothetical protein
MCPLFRFKIRLLKFCSYFTCGLCLVLAFDLFGETGLADITTQSAATPFVSEVDAWAMLFQMMGRLESAMARRELTLIDSEDPFASAAVSSLLAELKKRPGPQNVAQKMKWIAFVRLISTLHETADRNDSEKAVALMTQAMDQFEQLQATADPKTLSAARDLAKRYTCPMHPDVIGAKNDLCPKCGMALDQKLALLPVHLAGGNSATWQQVKATVSTDGPLEPGKLAHAVLHLRRPTGHAVTMEELLETHTHKIHLLIIDGSLTDYHHEHPEPTNVPGDYVFAFTPTKPGSYFAWVDLRPLPLGLQEYDKAMIAGAGRLPPIIEKKIRLAADSQGYRFELSLSRPEIKTFEAVDAKLTVAHNGRGFDQLEPVMGAFAHIVGFNEDLETVLHIHPIETRVLQPTDRGGPALQFKIYATKPGFTRFFAQVQIKGQQLFAPFGLEVQEPSGVSVIPQDNYYRRANPAETME